MPSPSPDGNDPSLTRHEIEPAGQRGDDLPAHGSQSEAHAVDQLRLPESVGLDALAEDSDQTDQEPWWEDPTILDRGREDFRAGRAEMGRANAPRQAPQTEQRPVDPSTDGDEDDDVMSRLRRALEAAERRRNRPTAPSTVPQPTLPSISEETPFDDEQLPGAHKQKPAAKRPKRSAKRTTSIHSDGIPEAPEDGESAATALPSANDLPPIEVEITPELKNLSKWRKAMGDDGHGLRLLKVVKPTKLQGSVSFLKDLLDEPVVDGRQHAISECRKTSGKRWSFELVDQARPDKPCVRFATSLVDGNLCPTKSDAEAVGRRICQYLDRLPVSPAETSTQSQTTFVAGLVQTAVLMEMHADFDWSAASDNAKIGFTGVFADKAPDEKCTGTTPVLMDDGEFKYHKLRISMNVHQVNMDISVPEPVDYRDCFPAFYDDATLAKKVKKELVVQYKQAYKVVRYVQSKLYGAVGTRQDLYKFKDVLLEPFLKEQHQTNKMGFHKAGTMHGPYNNKALVALSPRPAYNEMNILAGTFVAQDVNGKLPNINIRSVSKTRMAYVLERLMGTFFETGNVLEAWRAGCLTADLVNTGAISSLEIKLNYCQCSDEERFQTVHICQFCLSDDLCRNMGRNEFDCFVCGKCLAGPTRSDSSAAQTGEKLRHHIRTTLRRDPTIKKEDVDRLFDAIWDHVQQFRTPKGFWQDAWAKTERAEWVQPDEQPFSVSVEGVYPVALAEGKTVYHGHPSNIVLTALYLNRMKSQYLPAILGLISQSRDLVDQPEAEEELNALIDQFDHLYCVGNTYKSGNKAHRLKMPPDQVRGLIEKWKRPVAQLQEAEKLFFKIHGSAARLGRSPDMSRDWSPERIEAIKELMRQMESKFERKVHRAADGAPWPFIKHHMPMRWSWYQLWRLFSARLRTMQFECNKKWQTIDDGETLMLECVYQHLKYGGRDEFLGLPMTAYISHPLRFSIGHRHHGCQMRTGFKNTRPTNLDEEYDEGLSNICVETWVSNLAKWDYPEATYPAILKDLDLLRTQTDFFSVPNECIRFDVGGFHASEVPDTADFQEGDDDADLESDNELLEGDV